MARSEFGSFDRRLVSSKTDGLPLNARLRMPDFEIPTSDAIDHRPKISLSIFSGSGSDSMSLITPLAACKRRERDSFLLRSKEADNVRMPFESTGRP